MNQLIKNTIVETFLQNMTDIKPDSSSSMVMIDGISFDKLLVVAKINDKLTLTSAPLSKLYRGYDFGISYVYVDDDTKLIIEQILAHSKFKK